MRCQIIFSGMLLFVALLAGCKDHKADASNFSSGSEISDSVREQNASLDKKSYAGLEDVFQDTARISSHGKYLMLVFGKNNCGYCEKLKEDIKNTPKLKQFITQNFSPYYINIDYEKQHHFSFGKGGEQKEIDITTAQLSREIYKVIATPTTIFGDDSGKTILELPGYVPESDFQKILEFIVSKEWQKAKDMQARNELLQKYLRVE